MFVDRLCLVSISRKTDLLAKQPILFVLAASNIYGRPCILAWCPTDAAGTDHLCHVTCPFPRSTKAKIMSKTQMSFTDYMFTSDKTTVMIYFDGSGHAKSFSYTQVNEIWATILLSTLVIKNKMVQNLLVWPVVLQTQCLQNKGDSCGLSYRHKRQWAYNHQEPVSRNEITQIPGDCHQWKSQLDPKQVT